MIIHIDIDSFFVSAERINQPWLNNRPVAVGGRSDPLIFSKLPVKRKQMLKLNEGVFVSTIFQGDEDSSSDAYFRENGRIRGVVTTASYEARSFGIRSGMTIFESLKRCPSLTLIKPNMLLYHELSFAMRQILMRLIPKVEQYSIDEFFGDISGWVSPNEVESFAYELKESILNELQLPVSVGVSSAKWIAKLATSHAKPNGVKVVYKEQISSFTYGMPVDSFSGVGRAFSKKLERYKIRTIGEALEAKELFFSWGRGGRDLYARLRGDCGEEVKERGERKSIGMSRTVDAIGDREEIKRMVIVMVRHLTHTVMQLHLTPTSYSISVRYIYHAKSTHSASSNRLFSEYYFKEFMLNLFNATDCYPSTPIVRISIALSNFTEQHRKTLSLLYHEEDLKYKRVLKEVTKARNRYGIDIVRFAKEIL